MTYELKKGGLRAQVRTLGGELVSLKGRDGREHIWEGNPAFWPGQNPVLFPIVGLLKEGKIAAGGQICEMGRHGLARKMEFSLAELEEDRAVLELREDEASLARWPFPFLLRAEHRLLDSGFTTTYTVVNTGAAPMPFCIGAHTAIRLPDGDRFQDYELVFDVPEDGSTLLLDPEAGILRSGRSEPILKAGRLALDYDLFARLDTIIFRDLASREAALVHRPTGRTVRLDFSQFPMVAFWTKPGAPFLCMEPWHGCAALDDESGRFEDKPFCLILAPGEEKRLGYTFTLDV